MSLANLGDLKTAVADWLYRTGDTALAARADDFITLFEADFIADPEMRTTDMQEVDTAPISDAELLLPTGFLEMITLQAIGGALNTPNVELHFVTASERIKLDGTSATSGACKNYTLIANQIFLTPAQFAPIGATAELVYYKFVGLANSPGGANWLLQKYPNLYLYGSLMQAAAYVDDDAVVAKWKAGRDEAMAKIAASEKKRKVGGGALVVRPSADFIA